MVTDTGTPPTRSSSGSSATRASKLSRPTPASTRSTGRLTVLRPTPSAQPRHGREVHPQRRLPGFGGDQGDGTVATVATGDRVVDEHGEAAEPLDGGGDERVARSLVGEIHGCEDRLASFVRDRRGHSFA